MPVVTRAKLISITSVFILLKKTKSARRCNLVFKSGYELLAHKKQTGHIRGKKRKIVNIVATETNQRTITDIFTTPTETNQRTITDIFTTPTETSQRTITDIFTNQSLTSLLLKLKLTSVQSLTSLLTNH